MVSGKAAFSLSLQVVAALLGCSPAAAVEIGTGTTEFLPLEEGQELAIVTGIQGGHHIIVHARARDIAPGDPERPGTEGNPRSSFSAFLHGERIDSAQSSYRLGYREIPSDDDDGDFDVALPSGRLLIIDEEHVMAAYDAPVRLVVSVVDRDGRKATDERTILAVEESSTQPLQPTP